MENQIDKYLDAVCINEFGPELSAAQISEFTKGTNLDSYVICEHKNGKFCKYAVPFAEILMCRCNYIVESVKKYSE